MSLSMSVSLQAACKQSSPGILLYLYCESRHPRVSLNAIILLHASTMGRMQQYQSNTSGTSRGYRSSHTYCCTRVIFICQRQPVWARVPRMGCARSINTRCDEILRFCLRTLSVRVFLCWYCSGLAGRGTFSGTFLR